MKGALMKSFLYCIASGMLVSCVGLKTVSITNIPQTREQPVNAKVSKFIFLGLNFDNDFVDDLKDKLAAQCTNGTISGILTKHDSTSYLIAHTVTVYATGYCTRR